MSFENLKKQSKLGSLTEKLVKEVEKMNNSESSSDDRFWKLSVDKSNNGYAVIRFLPAPNGEDIPFVKVYSHAFQGPYEDETPINAFDFWQGANFKLKAKSVAGYRNYDSSEFASVGALLDDDDAMEAIWKKQYSLTEFVAPDQFKTYEELKKRLDSVLGAKSVRLDEEVDNEEEYSRGSARDLDDGLRSELNNLQPTRRAAAPVEEDEDDDALSYFAKLAED